MSPRDEVVDVSVPESDRSSKPAIAEPPAAAGRPEAAEPATSVTEPVHTAVPGRARLRVNGLRRSAAMARLLERGLAAAPGVTAASASPLTGTVLVHFDPNLPLDRIAERVAGLVRGDIVPPREDTTAVEAPGWHAVDAAAVATEFRTSGTAGLSEVEAEARLASVGRNALPQPPVRSGLGMFLSQFQNLPVGLLAVAAIVSFATGGGAFEAVAILTVVALNGGIGYVTERRSELTIRSLSAVSRQPIGVIRDGAPRQISPEAVVPGDLLVLRRGELVAADARIVAAHDLTLSEAVLTGESLPVEKSAAPLRDGPVALGDRVNMVYRGTVVTGGTGTAIAIATGAHTEVGRIQRLVAEAGTPETPMQRQLDTLGRQLVWLSMAVCGSVFGIGLLRGFGVVQMFRSAVSLAVAAIPEGLPTVATTTLALGIDDMRRRDVLIRKLDAVETLAAVQVLCLDKTGTLTLNRMSVAEIACGDRVFRVQDGAATDEVGVPAGSDADPRLPRLLRVGALCSETAIEHGEHGPELNGSSTENALVRVALDLGIDVPGLRDAHRRLSIRHRTEAYRFMLTTHRSAATDDAPLLVMVKGSPLEVLELCRWELRRDGTRHPLTPERRAAIEAANARMAEKALRVLGFAEKEVSDPPPGTGAAELDPGDLTWLGLAGMADPVRPGMRELMATFHRAGIHTVMVTGDQAATARAVAEQLGLSADGRIEIVDAADLETLPPDRLAEAARRAHAFARVSPAQKLQIVRALQRAGEIVAMTGDGVNDSPALKAADIGIALGRSGAEAAREVADVVLQTDDLLAMAVAVERGRATYTNVRKAIRYLLSTNLSEILVVLAATAVGIGEVLSPMQLLWINLISDVLPGLGLAFEAPEPDAMLRGPHPADEPIVRQADLGRLAGEATVIGAGALGACAYGALRYGANSAQARTLTFGSLVTAQLLHALTCRSARHGLYEAGSLPANRTLTLTLVLSFAAQAGLFLVPGLRGALGLAPLGAADALAVAAGGVAPYLLNEAIKSARLRGDEPRTGAPAMLPGT